MNSAIKHKVVSFVLFNIIWLSAVAGRTDYIWLTMALVLVQLSYSLWVARVSLRLILRLLAVGLLLEAIAISMGIVDFTGGLFPLWLTLLWVGFSSMAPVALDWLAKKPPLAALLGAISGPFTYWVGVGIGAGTTDSLPALVVTYAVVWALFMLFFSRAIQAGPNERLVI
ncbi:DUF2878 domain-containing protein [Idiomarina seosinensis]|uniref:DUF2878 domain-containing protein n=1 Tax=Idiomarina seosinensis TaxID=281739 RepID=UPI0038507F29